MGKMKKMLSAFLVVAVLCTSVVVPTLAAKTKSPTQGYYQKVSGSKYMVSSTTGKRNVAKKKAPSKKVTTDIVLNTVQINKKIYKVRTIGAHCYTGCTKLKKIVIKSKYIYKCNPKAFKGLKKAQVKKIKVYVTKKLSAKKFKLLKKALIKAGISAKNILRF